MGGAIAAGGKTINFDKKTITDNKTGVKSNFTSTKRGIIIRPNVTSIRTNTAREIQRNPDLIKKIGVEKSRAIIEAEQKRTQTREDLQRAEILNKNKLGVLNKILTNQQRQQLFRNLNRQTALTLQDRIKQIDRRKNLNVLQKENAKRRLVGVRPIVVQNNLFKKEAKKAALPKQISNIDTNLFNKVTTGQTITPQELKKFNSQIKTNQKDLTSKQIKQLKSLPVGVVVGFAKEGFDLLSFLVNGGLMTIKASANYIKNLPSRSKQQKLRIDQVVNNDLLSLERKINKAGQTFNNFSKEATIFAKKNPGKSFLIVSSAVASGMNIGLNEFDKNPGEVTGRALFWFKGDKILRGSLKTLQQTEKFIFSPKSSKSLQQQIKALEKIKNLTREQTQLLKDLRKLAQADKELIKLKNGLDTSIKVTRTKGKPKYNKTNFDKIQKAKKETPRINNKIKKKQDLIKKTKFKTLDSLQIGKLFRKFINEKEKKIIVQIKKGLPQSEKELIKLLKEARKIGGKTFKDLKKKIKSQFGLNVVQRGTGKNLTFKLLKPKKQARKGVKTAREKTKRFIIQKGKIIPETRQIRKSTPIKRPVKTQTIEKKLTKKDLKDLEFAEGQNLDKIQKDIRRMAKAGVFKNKKAQARLTFNTRKFYQKTIKNTNKIKNDVQKFLNKYHPNKTINPRNPRTQSFTNWSKADRERYIKEKKKISNAVKKANKDIKKVKSILGLTTLQKLNILNLLLSSQLSLLKQSSLQLNKQDSLFKNLQVQINKFENPKPKPIKPKSPKGKKQPIKKTTSRPRVKPKTPITPKKPKTKIRKIRTIPKTPKKPKKLIKLKLSFDNVNLRNRVLTFEGKFRERKFPNRPANKKTNPVVIKKLKITTTQNRMLNKVQTLADNRLVRSVDIKIVGATNRKVKDVKLNNLKNKFRKKLSSNSQVLRLVEKSKYISDRPGEKRELKKSKKISKAIKPKKKKVVKKKTSKSTRKKKNRSFASMV